MKIKINKKKKFDTSKPPLIIAEISEIIVEVKIIFETYHGGSKGRC